MVLVGCTNQRKSEATINHADSLMEKHQDSVLFALEILDSLKSEYPDFSTQLQMYYQLIYAKGMNKGYIDFTTDSVMKPVAEYYDDHGTSNEQMLAHYLLGCVYRDMGEYPAALSCYQDAVEKADTMDIVCDYGLLTRIYQQESDLFLHQNMPQNAMEVLEKAEKSAWIAKDTLATLIAKENKSYVYEQLWDYNAVIDNCMKVRELYLKYGYVLEANRILGVPLKALLYTKQYAKLKWCMDMYEAKSGYFSPKSFSNAVNYSGYYYIKGMYYLTLNNDSAYVCFLKAKKYSRNYKSCKDWAFGLYKLYCQKNNLDSIRSYADKAMVYVDSMGMVNEVDVMQNVASVYNYNRYKQIAQQRTNDALNKSIQIRMICVLALIIIICVSFIALFYAKNLKNKRKLDAMLIDDFKRIIAKKEYDLLSRKEELAKMERNNKAMTDEVLVKSKLILDLTNELDVLCEGETPNEKSFDANGDMQNKAIVKKFMILANDKKSPSENQWKVLTKVFDDFFPSLKSSLEINKPLTEKEYRLCMLIWLGFSPNELAILMDMSKTNVSNRRRMSVKLFGEDLSASKFDARIRQIKYKSTL